MKHESDGTRRPLTESTAFFVDRFADRFGDNGEAIGDNAQAVMGRDYRLGPRELIKWVARRAVLLGSCTKIAKLCDGSANSQKFTGFLCEQRNIEILCDRAFVQCISDYDLSAQIIYIGMG